MTNISFSPDAESRLQMLEELINDEQPSSEQPDVDSRSSEPDQATGDPTC